MDVLAVTDFPDIRQKTLIQSDQGGTLLIIPREGGYMARIYVEMETLGEGERARDRNISKEDLIRAAQGIFTLPVRGSGRRMVVCLRDRATPDG